MKSVFFNNEVLDVEKKIIKEFSIPSITLMENAGKNAAEFIKSKIKSNSHIVILTGKGNNAGDGFVIARHLANSKIASTVAMVYSSKDLKGDAFINYNILSEYKNYVQIVSCKNVNSSRKLIKKDTVIIDALFGIGFRGQVDARIRKIFEFINNIKSKTVFAIDVPSGLYSYNQKEVMLNGDYTISMGVKKFHSVFFNGRESSGENTTVKIGVEPEAFDRYNKRKIFEIEQSDISKLIVQRRVNSHKYSNGKVFALAGAKGLTGAAFLCSQAALRTGSGAVILGTPESMNTILARKLTEVMTLPLPETKDASLSLDSYKLIKNKIKWCDCLLIGPGVSKNPETINLISKIVNENDVPILLDADGLQAFKNIKSKNRKNIIILTPHFGEFASILGITAEEVKSDFYNLSVKFAKKHNVILVLKGSPSIITDGISFYINSSGNPSLATAGSGDVLSGIIASFYSRNKNPLNAALAGVFIHGGCADILLKKRNANFTTIASDLIKVIPDSIKSIIEVV